MPTAGIGIEDIVDEVFFEDNTIAFKTMLQSKGIVLIIYPPGSGKTTFALLLQSFLSSNIVWSAKLTTFFNNCEFSKSCKEDFEKFKNSANVAYINFEDVRGTNRAEFETSLVEIMSFAFEKHLPADISRRKVAALERTPGNVYILLY